MEGLLLLLGAIANWFGISDKFEHMIEMWNLSDLGFDRDQEYFEATYDFMFEMFFMFITMGTEAVKFISRITIEWFPVIEDLHIELSWLLIDFSRIARTIFNLFQFTIIFIITRKIKRKIRSRFQEETDWSKIKCF